MAREIRGELLTYLGARPGAINNKTESLPELCLFLGKALKWLSPWLDVGGPDPQIPPGDGPRSALELGEQFRQIGLARWNQPDASPDILNNLRLDLERTLHRLNNIQTLLNHDN